MADDINRLVMVGRLTRPAEKVSTGSGVDLVKFSIACNQRKKENDQWVDKANFFDFIYWGKRAAGIHPYLGKGQQVAVEGQLRQNIWEQDGKKRSKVEIEVTSLQLMGSQKDDGKRPVVNQSAGSGSNQFEDDIPF